MPMCEQAPEWAGSMVAHRVCSTPMVAIAREGTLSQKYAQDRKVVVMRRQGEVQEADGRYVLKEGSKLLFNSLGYHNHIRLTVRTEGASDRFGISLCRGTSAVCEADSGVYYSLVLNPESENRRKINFEQEGEDGKGFIANIDGYTFPTPSDNTYRIDIYTDNSVLVMYVRPCLLHQPRLWHCPAPLEYQLLLGTLSVSEVVSYHNKQRTGLETIWK